MNNLHDAPHNDTLDTVSSTDSLRLSKKLFTATFIALSLGFILSVISMIIFSTQVGYSVLFMTGGIPITLSGLAVAVRGWGTLGKVTIFWGTLFFWVGLFALLRFIGFFDIVLASFR